MALAQDIPRADVPRSVRPERTHSDRAFRFVASGAGLVTLADKGYQGSTWAKVPYKTPQGFNCQIRLQWQS